MPLIEVNNTKLFYDEYGSGDETIVFSHGLLWSGLMFHKQVALFKNKYRVITYDHRGQGRSDVPKKGYDMEDNYQDAIQLIEQLSPGKPVIFVGLSMGGFVGMRLAARRPELIKKLILIETSCEPEPSSNVPKYRFLNFLVKLFGVGAVVSPVMKIMFGKKFLKDVNRIEEKEFWKEQLRKNEKTITRAVNGVINRNGVEDELRYVACPTLIIVGDQDVATTVDKAKKINSLIYKSKLAIVSGAGHSSSIEEPEQVNGAMMYFLSE